MTIKSKQLYILIGDDRTGKTTLQKLLIRKICGENYLDGRLPTNKLLDIKHPEIKRKYLNISFGNRSYQEKKDTYGTIDEYFDNHFNDADIAFISTHLILNDVQQMIVQGRSKFFNVIGVFWSNSIEISRSQNSDISLLDWNERLVISNPTIEDNDQINHQLDLVAENIVDLIINRTSIS